MSWPPAVDSGANRQQGDSETRSQALAVVAEATTNAGNLALCGGDHPA
jgi:hypothetical protein